MSNARPEPAPTASVPRRPASVPRAAVAFGVGGGAVAAALLGAFGGSLDEVVRFASSSAIASALVALPCWALTLRPRRGVPRASRLRARGAGAGLMVGLASHPPTWWVFGLLDAAPLHEIGLEGLVLSTYSLPLYGWMTGILGALLGGALGRGWLSPGDAAASAPASP